MIDHKEAEIHQQQIIVSVWVGGMWWSIMLYMEDLQQFSYDIDTDFNDPNIDHQTKSQMIISIVGLVFHQIKSRGCLYCGKSKLVSLPRCITHS